MEVGGNDIHDNPILVACNRDRWREGEGKIWKMRAEKATTGEG